MKLALAVVNARNVNAVNQERWIPARNLMAVHHREIIVALNHALLASLKIDTLAPRQVSNATAVKKTTSVARLVQNVDLPVTTVVLGNVLLGTLQIIKVAH